MPGIEDLSTWRNELIRKALYGSVFIAAEAEAVPELADLFDSETGELLGIPDGYFDLGFLSDDGVTFPRELETEDLMSWQSTEPTRSDDTQDTSTASLVPQETNRATVALYEGIPLDDLPDVGEPWTWDKPANPLGLHWRSLFIGQDFYQGEPIYAIRLFPRAKVTSREDQQHNRANADTRGVTLTGYRDTALGTSVRNWIDGPGWRLLSESS